MNCRKPLAVVLLGFCCSLAVPALAANNDLGIGSSPSGASGSAADQQELRARIHTELGAGYFSRGQYAIALDELHTALNANDSYAPAYDVLGLVYMALGENKPAEDNFLRALDLAPGNPDIHNNYGWFLYNRGQYNDAMQQFTTALANPLYAKPQSALTNAGLCMMKLGKPLQAETYFGKALEHDPNDPQANYELANLYYQQQRYHEASRPIARLLANSAPTAKTLWLGVRIAHKSGDHDTEASDSLLLRNRFPDAPETQLLLQGKFD